MHKYLYDSESNKFQNTNCIIVIKFWYKWMSQNVNLSYHLPLVVQVNSLWLSESTAVTIYCVGPVYITGLVHVTIRRVALLVDALAWIFNGCNGTENNSG